MKIASIGKFSVIRDGTSYYRVLKGRKRIGSFLTRLGAVEYMNTRFGLDEINTVTAVKPIKP